MGKKLFRQCVITFVIAALLAGMMICTASASSILTFKYDISNCDFSSELEPDWNYSGNVSREHILKLMPGGGAVWQPLTVDGQAGNPAVGDKVFLDAELYIDPLIEGAGNGSIVARFEVGGLGNITRLTDLTGLERGTLVTASAKEDVNGGVIPDNTTQLWMGVFNDQPNGVIEVKSVKAYGIRDGQRVDYVIPNSDFSMPFSDTEGWGHNDRATIETALNMSPESSLWRDVAISEEGNKPHTEDKVSFKTSVYLSSGIDSNSSIVAKVSGSGLSIAEINDLSSLTRGNWGALSSVETNNSGKIENGASMIRIELRNDTNGAIRLKNLEVSGDREGFLPGDFNQDDAIDATDAQIMGNALKNGSTDLLYDWDRDGTFTYKDIACFKKLAVHDPNEFYVNTDHANWMVRKATIDGKEIGLVALYSEPIDRNDLSKGYRYVGDPQEGVTCLDDTARMVTALCEAYKNYKDPRTLENIKICLETVMYMQEPDGDFKNFLAMDADGNYFKRDSNSSFKDFGWWATRAYVALCAGYELLQDSDDQDSPELAQQLKTRMDLCNNRIHKLIDERYGTYTIRAGKPFPAWELQESWISAIAIDALYRHLKLFPYNESVKSNIKMLGEALFASQYGDFKEFPFGGIMASYDDDELYRWSEWGSQQVKALAQAGDAMNNKQWIDAAELAADSFLSDLLISGRAANLTPNKSPYAQIQYGTASYVDNYIQMYEITKKDKYLVMAGIAGTWYLGNNPAGAHTEMFNQQFGYAFDGIDSPTRVNTNSGGESNAEAIRSLSRLIRYPLAKQYMLSSLTATNKAITAELEDAYMLIPDVEYGVENGSLNDENLALISKSYSECTKYEADDTYTRSDIIPAECLDTEAEIYQGWMGMNGLYITGDNNTRLYGGSYLYTEVPLGTGENQPKAGDFIKLEFTARVEFDTNFNAEVFAVDASGVETLIADDSKMIYHPRDWYSGTNTVKTEPIAPIPEGTVKLKVRFSVETNPQFGYGKCYGSFCRVRMFKMNSPEVKYGSNEYSNSAYIQMPVQTSKMFDVTVNEGGLFDIYISARFEPKSGEETAKVELLFNDDQTSVLQSELLDEESSHVNIVRLGTVSLKEGKNTVKISNISTSKAAGVDAIMLYPVRTYAEYMTNDGNVTKIVRDISSSTLIVGKPQDVDNMDNISFDLKYSTIKKGKRIYIKGTVTNANETKPAKNQLVTMTIGEKQYTAKTDGKGRFFRNFNIPSDFKPGICRVVVSTKNGEANLYFSLVSKDKK